MPEIVREGDAAVRIAFDDRIDHDVNARVVSAAAAVIRAGVAGVLDVVPAFSVFTVYFDPPRTDVARLLEVIEDCSAQPAAATSSPPRIIEVPVCYGGEFGP